MKRLTVLTVALSAALAVQPADAADVSAAIRKVYKQAAGALAVVEFEIQNEISPKPVTTGGIGVCIKDNGLLMTNALDVRAAPKQVVAVKVILPGAGGKTLKAELLGIDRVTRLTFVRATEPHTWSVVRFKDAATAVGDLMVSVGLRGRRYLYQPYAGAAYVASRVRTPAELVQVTGGTLTNAGSPVFNAEGYAVGLVGQQLPEGHQMVTERGPARVAMFGTERTTCFMPASEFADALKDIPSGGTVRRVPWFGVLQFRPLGAEAADQWKIDEPAVVIGKVVADTPAAKAGLKDGDIIVKLNGEPLDALPEPDMVMQRFRQRVAHMRPGTKLSLTVKTFGQTRTVNLATEAAPTRPEEADRYFQRTLGILVREKVMLDEYLDPGATGRMEGLYVQGVLKDSPAEKAQLRNRDLVVSANGKAVTTVSAFQQTVEGALRRNPTQPVTLMVRRGEQSEAITILPPAPE
jgi:serine protease Do